MDEVKRQPIEGLKQYENKWVAIHETEAERKVVGSGDDAVEAIRDAEENGYEDVILQEVFPFDSFYVPSA